MQIITLAKTKLIKKIEKHAKLANWSHSNYYNTRIIEMDIEF